MYIFTTHHNNYSTFSNVLKKHPAASWKFHGWMSWYITSTGLINVSSEFKMVLLSHMISLAVLEKLENKMLILVTVLIASLKSIHSSEGPTETGI